MALNSDMATEQYQTMYDALMAVAQDYQTSEKATEIALTAANKLTLRYIDNAIEDINQLSSQYSDFIRYMGNVLADLENTLIDDALVVPLQKELTKAKKRITKK